MNLLYSYAFGKDYYFLLAAEMVKSARLHGFTGEIVILTDRPYSFEGAKTCVMEMTKNDLWRTAILRAVNTDSFEKILYVDTDVVFTRNPDYLMKSDKVAISTIGNSLCTAIITNHYLTEKEKREAEETKNRGICSGTISFPGKLAKEFMPVWEDRWKSFDKSNAPYIHGREVSWELWDECALQSMCLRGEIDWEFIPSQLVNFPCIPINIEGKFNRDTACMHFVGFANGDKEKAAILEWMQTAQNPLAIPVMLEKIRATCTPPQTTEEKIIAVMGFLKSRDEAKDKQIADLTRRVLALEKKEEMVFN